ncbi:MAG: zf-HC2 domain-containing protein [bacterium]|nr:zf-HC2 domain-containing protein [bacterium]
MANLSSMHLTPDELTQYFEGTLDDRRVREHLSTCSRCRSRLKDLALTRISMSPPSSALPGKHVPPEILAQYVEDTLSMEQNRAVEEHLGECRRCLGNLVSLRKAAGMPLDQAPREAASARVKESLDDYRRVTPLGSVSFKRFRDRVNLAYKPAPEADDPEAYTERTAKYRYPFSRADLRSRIEDMAPEDRFEASADMDAMAELESVLSYAAGEMLHRHAPSEPSTKTVITDDARIFFSLDERDGKQVLTVEIGDVEGVNPISDIEIELTPLKGEPVTVTTDPAGKAVLQIPPVPSTLRIRLERIYEIDLKTLL